MALIDRLPDFIKSPRHGLSQEDAGSLYREQGGILKTYQDRLVFPDSERLVDQLAEAMLRKTSLTGQIRFWHRQHRQSAPGNVLDDVARVTDVLYWEHLLKLAMEKEYRESFEKVDLPIKRMKEERYRRVIEQFVRDEAYRNRLASAKTGIIGKASGSMNESAEKNKQFRRNIVDGKLERLKEERDKVLERIKVLEALLRWSLRSKVE
jgi:hypothetical protein